MCLRLSPSLCDYLYGADITGLGVKVVVYVHKYAVVVFSQCRYLFILLKGAIFCSGC